MTAFSLLRVAGPVHYYSLIEFTSAHSCFHTASGEYDFLIVCAQISRSLVVKLNPEIITAQLSVPRIKSWPYRSNEDVPGGLTRLYSWAVGVYPCGVFTSLHQPAESILCEVRFWQQYGYYMQLPKTSGRATRE
jgi:hypothetical protein